MKSVFIKFHHFMKSHENRFRQEKNAIALLALFLDRLPPIISVFISSFHPFRGRVTVLAERWLEGQNVPGSKPLEE
jgi:hypothetical protein